MRLSSPNNFRICTLSNTSRCAGLRRLHELGYVDLLAVSNQQWRSQGRGPRGPPRKKEQENKRKGKNRKKKKKNERKERYKDQSREWYMHYQIYVLAFSHLINKLLKRDISRLAQLLRAFAESSHR